MFEIKFKDSITFTEAEVLIKKHKEQLEEAKKRLPINDLSSVGWFDRWNEDQPKKRGSK